MAEHEHDPEAVTAMTEQECWALLERGEFGHLAYHDGPDVDIRPINYLAHEGRLLFRTAEGSKLVAMTVDATAAFEVDEITADSGASVIVRGIARRLTEAESDSVDQLPLRTWLPTLKYNVMVLAPRQVSGRRFHLTPHGGSKGG